ncbi:MAG: hypothetical protein CMJ83_12285 [Planctomycetes bacterium]|nr:hypothetical protein [Planctomycetota bacterium]
MMIRKLLVLLAVAATANPQELPLTIVPSPQQPAAPALARGGVPVPLSANIRQPWHVEVRDGLGNVIPAGIRVVARGPETKGRKGAARWLLVSVPYGGASPAGMRLVVTPDGKRRRPKWPASGNPARGLAHDGLEVRLGNGTPTLIDHVRIGGHVVMKRVVLRFEDEAGEPQAFRPGPPTVEVHDEVEVRWRWRATFPDGLRATVRLTATRGTPVLRVTVRIENPGPCPFGKPGGVRYFKHLSLDTATEAAGRGAFDGRTPKPRALPLRVELTQIDRKVKNYERNLVFKSSSPDGEKRGLVHRGAVAWIGADRGLVVARRHAGFEPPARFVVSAKQVSLGLLPRGESGPHFAGQFGRPGGDPSKIDPRSLNAYRLEGGRWKSFELALLPLASPPTPVHLDALARTLESPPLIKVAPEYVTILGEPGVTFAPFQSKKGDPSVRRFQRLLEILVDDRAADPLKSYGRIGLPELLRRGGTYHTTTPYGWYNFGDIPWGSGYCSLHYDWVRTMMCAWLGSGDRRFFDQGVLMAAHQRDLDIVHTQPADQWAGGQRFEKGWWHGNAYIPVPSHHWLTGLFLHWVMTGDPGTRETLDEAGDYLMRQKTHAWSGLYGARQIGWPLDNLITMWLIDGDPRYQQRALATLESFESFEKKYGGKGYALQPRSKNAKRPDITVCWQHAILLAAGCRYVSLTGDQTPVPLLKRVTRHLVTHHVIRAQGRRPAHVWEWWSPGYHSRPSIHLSWFVQDALSRAAYLFNDHETWTVAKELFDGASRFHQGIPKNASVGDQHTWSPIGARMMGYPTTESKILGQIGRMGMAHPWFRARMK